MIGRGVLYSSDKSMHSDVYLKLVKLVALMVSLLSLAGCSSTVVERGFNDYLGLAPQATFDPVDSDPRLAGFIKVFGGFSHDLISDGLDDIYAEKLYFNDTFHSFTKRADLKEYLLGLTSVAETTVTVLDASAVGNDVLLRWKMNTKGKVLWKTLDIDSVGITHLRFNEDDQIILHQDYWDGVQGFYAHVPLIGSPLKYIRSKVGEK